MASVRALKQGQEYTFISRLYFFFTSSQIGNAGGTGEGEKRKCKREDVEEKHRKEVEGRNKETLGKRGIQKKGKTGRKGTLSHTAFDTPIFVYPSLLYTARGSYITATFRFPPQ